MLWTCCLFICKQFQYLFFSKKKAHFKIINYSDGGGRGKEKTALFVLLLVIISILFNNNSNKYIKAISFN